MTRTDLLNLYKTSQAAYAKFKRNADKLAWLDATRRMGAEVIAYSADLDRYEAEYKAASAKFSTALASMRWSAEEVVSFITEAHTA